MFAEINMKYSPQNPFVYEKNRFSDHFRTIPFIRLKKMLDRNKINLDNKTILIASCGSGIDAHYLKKFYPQAKFSFSDINLLPAEKTKSNFPKEKFVLANNMALAFKSASFDYVFVGDALHHLKAPLKGLYELLRVARVGVLVIEPNDSWLTRLFVRLSLASEYEIDHGNYVYRFGRRDVAKISKALLTRYDITRFFAIHRVAKTRFEFIFLKVLNGLANLVYPEIGNYIAFIIKK